MAKGLGYRMMVFMSKRMIACDEASFLISYRLDNRLGIMQWVRLKMHLISCHLCRKYAIQIDQLQTKVTEYRMASAEEPCHHHLSDHACGKIQQAVDQELSAR